MVVWNNNNTMEPIFILRGFPGLECVHFWFSIPFCLIYLVAFIGNVTILSVIWIESSLHQPMYYFMYYFLSILALTDLGMSMSTLPTMLAVLWLDAQEIQASACYAQLFFIHTSTHSHSWSPQCYWPWPSIILLLFAVHCAIPPSLTTV